ALDSLWFALNQAERPVLEHAAKRERAAGHALAVGAVTGVDYYRGLRDLVAHRTTVATAGLREFHRIALLWSAAETSRGNRIAVAFGVIVPSRPPGTEGRQSDQRCRQRSRLTQAGVPIRCALALSIRSTQGAPHHGSRLSDDCRARPALRPARIVAGR